MLRGSGRFPRTRPCPPASATAEEADGVASQAAPPLFPEFAAKRKIMDNSSTAPPGGIPERDGGFAQLTNARHILWTASIVRCPWQV